MSASCNNSSLVSLLMHYGSFKIRDGFVMPLHSSICFPFLTLSLFSGTHILYSRSKFLCTNTYRLYELHRTGITFKGHINDPFYDVNQAEKKLAQGRGIWFQINLEESFLFREELQGVTLIKCCCSLMLQDSSLELPGWEPQWSACIAGVLFQYLCIAL